MTIEHDSMQSQIDHLNGKFKFVCGVLDKKVKVIEELEHQVKIIRSQIPINNKAFDFDIAQLNQLRAQDQDWYKKLFEDQDKRLQKLEREVFDDVKILNSSPIDNSPLIMMQESQLEDLHKEIAQLKEYLKSEQHKTHHLITLNAQVAERSMSYQKEAIKYKELFYEVRNERDNLLRGQSACFVDVGSNCK